MSLWDKVSHDLEQTAKDATNKRLNEGQRASLHAIAERLPQNGVIIADEVGMGKTRIAVEVAKQVKKAKGRIAILVPAGVRLPVGNRIARWRYFRCKTASQESVELFCRVGGGKKSGAAAVVWRAGGNVVPCFRKLEAGCEFSTLEMGIAP